MVTVKYYELKIDMDRNTKYEIWSPIPVPIPICCKRLPFGLPLHVIKVLQAVGLKLNREKSIFGAT